ncbi:GM10865 [Drosophila sechellia]|uniref:GM10865 n=1 Tax=Drosophila sechellia TaxID=7238 RepID=B4IMM6_DROSE|nr:GM10865 [Drosophila sechellia]
MAEGSGSRSKRQEIGQERRDSSRGRRERREASHDRRETARAALQNYAKVAKQVREWSFRYDGNEKPLEFLEQVEWSAMTYGLDINQIPRAMPELLTGRALKWFFANNKFWETWIEFIQSFQEFFLPRGFMTKLADQVRQRKQRHENFKDFMVDMQTLMRPLGMSQKETLFRIRENSTPALRMFIRPYECRHLDALMALTDEFDKLDTQRERFDLERNNRARHQRDFRRGDQNVVCRRCQDDPADPARNNNNRRDARFCAKPSTSLPQMRWPGPLVSGVQEPADQFLLDLRENRSKDFGMLPQIGKRHATPASEGQPGFARCSPSKLMGNLKAEERQLSATVLIDGVEIKATVDTGATASFISEELADRLQAAERSYLREEK